MNWPKIKINNLKTDLGFGGPLPTLPGPQFKLNINIDEQTSSLPTDSMFGRIDVWLASVSGIYMRKNSRI